MGLRLPHRPSALRAGQNASGISRAAACAGAILVAATAAIAALTIAPGAQAATCGAAAVTVTSMHSPDGTQRPFYADFGHASTNHSGYVGYELNGASLGSDVWIKLSGFTGGKLGLASNQSAAIPARATSQGGKPLVYAYLTASAATASAQTFTVEVWNGKPDQTGSTQVCATSDGFSSVEDIINAAANKITSISVSNSAPALGGSFDVSASGTTGTMGAGLASDQSGGNGVFSMAPAMDDSWPADAFSLTGVQTTIGGSTFHDRLRIYPGTAAQGAYTSQYSFTVRGTTAGATSVLPVQSIASGTQVKYTGSYPGAISQISAPAVTTSLAKTAQSVTGPPYHVTYQVVATNADASAVTLDYLRDTPTPTGSANWTFDAGSARLGGSTIADPTLDSGALVFGGPFSIPAHSSLTFTYTLSVSTAISNSAVGTIGGVTVGASGGGNQVSVDPTTPTVTTPSLADGTTGSSYSATLAATGGTGSYTWSVTLGSLPAGLLLNTSTGVIHGTPTGTGTATFTVSATDGTPKTGSKSLTLTVNAAGGGPADTTAPSGSVSLNGGAAATTSTVLSVALAATDDTAVTAYRIAEGTDCSAASWVTVTAAASFSTTAALTVASGDGVKTVCVQFKDAAGNVSSTYTHSITLDTAAPTVVLSSAAASTVAGAFSVTATFSESVTGFIASDITVGNGTVSGLSGSGTTYSFTVTPTADGTVTVDIAGGAATDVAGNVSAAATQLSRSADSTHPSLTLASAAPSPTNAPFTVTATFSESVTGFDASDVTLGNGTASAFSGSGTTYSFTVTPTADGAVTVDVAANAAADAAGNGSTAAAQLTRTYDASAPTVTLATAAVSPLGGAFTVSATFSKSISGFDASDIVVGNGTVSGFSGSGSNYSFTVTPSADGTVSVDVAAGAATDSSSNENIVAAQLARIADLTRPSVTLASTSTNPTQSAFDVTVTFTESVTGLVLGDFSLANATASNLTGSGAVYTFTVTPATVGDVTVSLGAGKAQDPAGNDNVAAADLTRTYDPTAPTVTIGSHPAATVAASTALFTFAADEPASLSCSLDGVPFSACSSPLSLVTLLAGPHTLVVRARDSAGNVGSMSYTWTIAAPPVVTFIITPAALSEQTASFAWSASGDGTTFTCVLDSDSGSACASPYTIGNLADGPHTLTVEAHVGTTLTGSTTFHWSSRHVVPTPNLQIIPKISPTDMLGRPGPFRQSFDAPHSNGPFTRKLQVTLHVPTPDVHIDNVFISNYPDFHDERRFAVAADELYDWELLPGPSGDRPVYIRFADEPGAPVGTANIVLDQELPFLSPRPLATSTRLAAGLRHVATVRTIYCGAAPRRWLKLPGTDGFSGLNAVQIASNRAHPCAWRPYLPALSYRLPGKVVWLRVEDRVGNISKWYRVVRHTVVVGEKAAQKAARKAAKTHPARARGALRARR